MEIAKENTAPGTAILQQDSDNNKPLVCSDRFAAEKNYRIAGLIVNKMLEEGLIIQDDIAVIDTKIRELTHPISGSIFC